MNALLVITLMSITAVAAAADAALPLDPAAWAAGSQLPLDENTCATCHGEADLWEEDKLHLHIPHEGLADDVHFAKGVNCHDCHGGDPSSFDVPQAHSTEVAEDAQGVLPFRSPPGEVKKVCGNCHRDEASGVVSGMHGAAGDADDQGPPGPLACEKCHGEVKHRLLPADDPRSPVFIDSQVKLCGDCHQQGLTTYEESVHGHGLRHSGLLVTASCADCHGAHGIYPSDKEDSTLHAANVAATCGKCHRFIEERLKRSVHGAGNGPGEPTEEAAPGSDVMRKPSCTDCHAGHDLPHPKSASFRRQLRDRCGDCHGELSKGYGLSLHGALTELGYGPAAKCSDCHGAHDILPISNPDSLLSSVNREETCRKCHALAANGFLEFDPHADHTDPEKDPILYWVYTTLIILIISVFGLCGLHSLLWLVRSLLSVLKHGRPKALVPGAVAYVRFGPFHRVAHVFIMVSFLGLALTGLPLKYSDHQWAKDLAYSLGGFESTSLWHRIFGLVNFGCLAAYLLRMSLRLLCGGKRGISVRDRVFGPDSPVPNSRDVRDFFKMARWFLGLGPKPTFERWSYWEKFDFWGACADIVIIGFTGVILWFPNLFTAFLPGITLNIAKVVHSTQALLATGFVFAIHFFNAHMRAEKFPADLSVLTGLVSEEELLEERPEFVERMRREGKLEQLRTTVPSRVRLWLIAAGGALALAVGLSLLLGILLAVFSG